MAGFESRRLIGRQRDTAGPREVEVSPAGAVYVDTGDSESLDVDLRVGNADVGPLNPVPVSSVPADPNAVSIVTGVPSRIEVTPTITAGAYTVGDVCGGVQTLLNVARTAGGAVVLKSFGIRDLAKQDSDFVIWFFDEEPTNGTYTDNAPLDIHDTDHAMLVGWMDVYSSDFKDAADNSMAYLRNSGLQMTANGSRNLYAIAQINTADTYVGTSDLTFLYEFEDF